MLSFEYNKTPLQLVSFLRGFGSLGFLDLDALVTLVRVIRCRWEDKIDARAVVQHDDLLSCQKLWALIAVRDVQVALLDLAFVHDEVDPAENDDQTFPQQTQSFVLFHSILLRYK